MSAVGEVRRTPYESSDSIGGRGEGIIIKENINKILSELPGGVEIVAAAKSRTPEEIIEAIEAGVKIIGENYVQDAEQAFKVIGNKARWHFIGHLQKNKVKKAIEIFDMIETVDSAGMADEISKRCSAINKTMQVLIEINSAREEQKSGVFPENAEKLIKEISILNNLKVMGFMTMGPAAQNAEDIRPYFRETKKLFEDLKMKNITNTEIKYLSMGMSDSYKVAVEEGSNMVRLGTAIFGERKQ